MSRLIGEVLQLRAQLIREHTQAPGLFREMAHVENLLAETYRARVLYELLQNSDDAGAAHVRVSITDERLAWSNDGRPFTSPDFEALCRSASSTKTRGDSSIGYRGIGFKAVASVAQHVEVRSAGLTLHFDRSAAAESLGSTAASTPLLRVPSAVEASALTPGAEFVIHLSPSTSEQLALHPISMLFLRNVESLELSRGDSIELWHCQREPDKVTLSVDGRSTVFHRMAEGDVQVLVPADPHALSLTGRRGRLCCFLPLDDELGLPAIASGPVLTDPSRTHATISDPATQAALETVGSLVGRLLMSSSSPASQRLWDLLMHGEDLRQVLLEGGTTIGSCVLSAAKRWMNSSEWHFSFSEIPLDATDVELVFPQGAPSALYREDSTSAARSLRTAFGAPTLRAGELANSGVAAQLSAPTRSRLSRRLLENARVEGRNLTEAEQNIVGSARASEPEATSPGLVDPRLQTQNSTTETFSGAMSRWRTAEVAVLEYLNQRGWELTDVSRQNVGYDLEGAADDGIPVHIEVKKVESKNSRFSLTNNEMSVMVGASNRYLLAIVIGDGASAQLALLDPLLDQVPRERVCRRWEWEYTDWSRFVTLVA
ncbi:DUF3883 domain-containing protein [Kytococcus sedentarius]|uniref:DUF3883 domain-containing protein n=1 Tax=Kytococcus sedentarius TaxID=1276 RepID=UPI0002DCBC71|nr:DUF3883 domain-containing protein [Kytococcus sedentarius]QQB63212.1 DUF3883 domain-containing protein [Kytococcus sedentarius]STX13921.1 Uncharacterised protein [Kytococcus sedentarius]